MCSGAVFAVVRGRGDSPVQLLHGHGDLQVVAQHVEGGQDVCPLNHLPQRPALQDLGAKHVSGLLRQEAHVDQDLSGETFTFSHI